MPDVQGAGRKRGGSFKTQGGSFRTQGGSVRTFSDNSNFVKPGIIALNLCLLLGMVHNQLNIFLLIL